MRQLILDDRGRCEFIRRIQEITLDGKRKFIGEFKVYRLRRSLPQNSLLHLWLACIAMEQFGSKSKSDIDLLKDYFKEEFLPVTEREFNGKKMKVLTHTSDLDTAQFAHFLDNIQNKCHQEWAIYLPQPGEEGWEQFYTQYGIK
jgi:hypothetical protein